LLKKDRNPDVHSNRTRGTGTAFCAGSDLNFNNVEDAQIGYRVVRSINPPDNQFSAW